MTSVLIAGATGLVGGLALAGALSDVRNTQVVAPTRRPLPPHPRLNDPVVDFDRLPLQADWWAIDGAICALGTTRTITAHRRAARGFRPNATIADLARIAIAAVSGWCACARET